MFLKTNIKQYYSGRRKRKFCRFIVSIFTASLIGWFSVAYLVKAVTLNVTIVTAEQTHTFAGNSSFARTLANPDNTSSLRINFSSGSLETSNNVKMEIISLAESFVTANRPLPSNKMAVDTFYNISFTNENDNSSVTSFNKSFTLTFTYNDSDVSGIDESTLTAYRWNGSSWAALSNNVVDTAANTVTATVQETSFFSLIGNPPASPAACGDGTCNGDETCGTCSADCGSCVSAGGSGGGGGGGGSNYSPAARVIFSGRAYPKRTVTLLKDAQVAATTIAGLDANFQIDLSGLSSGNYIFSVYSEDNKGVRSSLFTFPISVTQGATTDVSGVFIAPTIAVDKNEVKRGDNVAIFGQSAPQADIVISVNSEEEFFGKAVSDKNGVYLYNFNTIPLEMGQHFTKSRASISNLDVSGYSQTVSFIVGTKNIAVESPETAAKGDTNNDGRVNLVDFSVAAYWYKRISPPAAVDLNSDGAVNLVDFSILAYYWTG